MPKVVVSTKVGKSSYRIINLSLMKLQGRSTVTASGLHCDTPQSNQALFELGNSLLSAGEVDDSKRKQQAPVISSTRDKICTKHLKVDNPCLLTSHKSGTRFPDSNFVCTQ